MKEEKTTTEKQDLIKLLETRIKEGIRDYSACVDVRKSKESDLYYGVLLSSDELQSILKTLKS